MIMTGYNDGFIIRVMGKVNIEDRELNYERDFLIFSQMNEDVWGLVRLFHREDYTTSIIEYTKIYSSRLGLKEVLPLSLSSFLQDQNVVIDIYSRQDQYLKSFKISDDKSRFEFLDWLEKNLDSILDKEKRVY